MSRSFPILETWRNLDYYSLVQKRSSASSELRSWVATCYSNGETSPLTLKIPPVRLTSIWQQRSANQFYGYAFNNFSTTASLARSFAI